MLTKDPGVITLRDFLIFFRNAAVVLVLLHFLYLQKKTSDCATIGIIVAECLVDFVVLKNGRSQKICSCLGTGCVTRR